MLELAILGLLKEQELHGYELKKRLADTLGGARSGVSYGSLYPALGRLEAAGAVSVVDEEAVGGAIPLTGSLGGELAAFRARRSAVRSTRGKKVYRLTDRGDQLFAELLSAESASAEDERLFNLRLAFAAYLPADTRIGMLERRRAHLVERLTRLSVRVRTSRDRLDNYARSLLEHDREAAEHDLSWIDRLLSAERAAARTPSAGQAADREDAVAGATAEASVSETSVSEASVSEASVSETSVSETSVSETSVSETSVSETGASQIAPVTPLRPFRPSSVTPAVPTTVGHYRPSLSGLRPRTSEENTTV